MSAYLPQVPRRRSVDLAAAAHLEIGLEALERGNLPLAIGALASIDDDSWDALLTRFPTLPDLITRGTNQ
jgi:hypothetical protein